LGISTSLSSGFHPQTNGQTERLNQDLKTGFHLLCRREPSSWSDKILWIEYAYNTLPTAATGLALFQVVHSFLPPTLSNQEPWSAGTSA
ncbi:hypothetical protein C0J45_23177, partial [Silurus meridionalis]